MPDAVDRTVPAEEPAKAVRLQDKITHLEEQMQALKQVEVRVQAAPDGQISLTDADARSMATAAVALGWLATTCRLRSIRPITSSSRMKSPILAMR